MTNFTQVAWQEFFLRTLTLHWLTALAVVTVVALMVTGLRRLNATTRHNIWLLTLVSLALMPLLIFAPRLEMNLPTFQLTSSTKHSEQIATTVVQDTVDAGTPVVAPESSSLELASVNTIDPAQSEGNVSISLSLVLKGIVVFWLVGVLFLLRRLWSEYRAARELELQSDSVTPYFERRFDQLCARLGIDERPLLRFHAGISAPMTVGLIRVWVAIPMTWRETIDDSVFDQTLTHELGHIARKDPLTHTLQRILSILFWMYPAVWYVSRQLEIERESACDDWVLTHDGKGNTYATNLLDVAESLYLQPQVLAVGCLRSHSQLSRRIQNLLNKSSDHKLHNSWKLLALTSAGLMITLSVSAVAWPDARQLAPPAAIAVIDPLSSPVPRSVVSTAPEPGGMNRFDATAETAVKAVPAPQAPPSPHKLPVSGGKGAETRTTMESDGGKLEIERLRSGKSRVSVKPEITVQTPVLYAAWTGDIDRLKKLASHDKKVLNTIHERSHAPRTALEAAILKGHMKVVEKLISLGVDLSPDTPANSQFEMSSPLTIAAMIGNYNMAKLLLNNDVKPDDSTFLVAVQNRDVRLVELFLKRNSCECFVMDDALLAAVKNKDKQILSLLLKYGVKVDKEVLHFAVKANNTKTVNRLLKNYEGNVGDYLLNFAIQNRNSGIVDSLIKAGAEPEKQLVTLAVQQRDVNLVKKLIDNNARIQESALVLAIQQRDAKMVQTLLDGDAPVADGALVMALQNGDLSMAKNLLNHNAELGPGSLVIAIQSQDVALVQKLLDAGAPISDGALIVAAQSGNTELIKLIRKRSGRSEEDLSSLLRSFDESGQFASNYRASTRADKVTEAIRTNRNTNVNANKNANRNSHRHGGKGGAYKSHHFDITHWPVKSRRISLDFDDSSVRFGGHDKPHEALDFPMKEGSSVYAVAGGVVSKAGYSKGYGNYIVIDHGDGYETKYANNKVNKVGRGDYVKARQVIALVGDTARDSTGPHLHFEVYCEGLKIDPQLLFKTK